MIEMRVFRKRYEASCGILITPMDEPRQWKTVSIKGNIKKNSSHVVKYIKSENKWTCDCKDHEYRATMCKHIIAVMRTVKNIKFEIMEV